MDKIARHAIKAFFKENGRLLICTALAFIAGLLAGVSWHLAAGQDAAEYEGVETSAIGLVRVLPTTDITLETHFAICGHTVERMLDPAAFVGCSKSEMAERFSGAAFETFSATRVTVRNENAGCCPVHLLLRSDADGCLRVYRTDETSLAEEEVQNLGTVSERLEESAAAELMRGVAFDSITEINAYLENAES